MILQEQNKTRKMGRQSSQFERVSELSRSEVEAGDLIVIHTHNSVYYLRCDNDMKFIVSGGYFDSDTKISQRIGISGCTWGGSAINTEMLAVRGMQLEFANHVTTSSIRKIKVLKMSRWLN